jgi:hypothetical protein
MRSSPRTTTLLADIIDRLADAVAQHVAQRVIKHLAASRSAATAPAANQKPHPFISLADFLSEGATKPIKPRVGDDDVV